jgi:hypothetical protein
MDEEGRGDVIFLWDVCLWYSASWLAITWISGLPPTTQKIRDSQFGESVIAIIMWLDGRLVSGGFSALIWLKTVIQTFVNILSPRLRRRGCLKSYYISAFLHGQLRFTPQGISIKKQYSVFTANPPDFPDRMFTYWYDRDIQLFFVPD